MTKETYRKAMQLNDDILLVNYHLKKQKKTKHGLQFQHHLEKMQFFLQDFKEN